MPRLTAIYRIRSDAAGIEARARGLAVEQSVEMPVEAIDDATVLAEIVGRVDDVRALGQGVFEVRIGLAVATTGAEPGQLLNMLFGNSSIQDDVVLHDVELPADLARGFGGPNHGLAGLRRRCGADGRAMTCSALKPQGLSAGDLALLARRMAEGGIDFVKDDHGLADQGYSPFAERVRAVTGALAEVARATGRRTCYVPSLSGDLDAMRRQVALAREFGVDAVLIQPMVAGVANFHALVRASPDMAFMAHPAMAGAARIAPPLLLGRLFRMLGADATVFPNFGGRFGYSPETCRALAEAARMAYHGLGPSVPVPAGGMTTERVAGMLDFYGRDVMLLVGGALLSARERLAEHAAAFVRQVAGHGYGQIA
ncbi:MAG: RuBisCO large subunit C-terminal-like domain-containing protein [Alphaproteobacteria bacterium]|nr:RuBisCO large subunit C-terminal-like domain-containing protein [Alphaproteobacteria bacterium]